MMTDKLSYILIVFTAVAILWRLYKQGWTLKSPIPRDPWKASLLLAAAILLTARRSWHMPELRTNLNIIIATMVLPAAVQLYRTLRDSRRSQEPPAWAGYGAVCLVCFFVADGVFLALSR